MKILALRVKNLTSLAGEVELDFEAPPLAHAGLFAITGPTGAGKSTLLDALCLALYDEMPRLPGTGDVRSVLRHGTAGGHAEVDFVGRDGGRYRARWQIKRAYNKPSGRLQNQEMSLTDLASGTVTAGGKREVLRAIEDTVGLDYHQFRRSVLLAQNDFDAFLRAKPDERAGLLELMTGTVIYGELSRAAYERSKSEDYALKALDEELKRVNVLADDERTAVETQAEANEQRAAQLGDEVEGLTREVEWYRTTGELTRRLGDAECQLSQVHDIHEQAQPERDRMARVRRALALEPLVAEADRLSAEGARLQAEHQSATDNLAETEAAKTEAEAAREAARIADEQAEAAFKAAAPALDQAAELDTRIAAAGERLEQLRIAAEAAAQAEVQARVVVERLSADHKSQADTLQRLREWVNEHSDHAAVAEQSDRWLDAITAHAEAIRDHRSDRARTAQAEQDLQALASRKEADERTTTQLSSQLSSIEQAIAEQTRLLDGVDLDALDRRRDGLDALTKALAEIDTLITAAAALDRRRRDLDGRRTGATARQAQATEARAKIEAALETQHAARIEAEAALALAEAAEGEQAAILRQRLLGGEPCPVCGSRDHPLDEIHTTLTGLLDAQRRRVSDLKAENERLLTQRADVIADERSATETLSHAAADTEAINGERTTLSTRWQTATSIACDLADRWDIGLSPLPDEPAPALDVDGDRAACEAELEEIGERLRSARAAEAERRRLAAQRETVQGKQRDLARVTGEREAAQAKAATEEWAARADADRAVAAMAQAAERLTPAMTAIPNWHELLEIPDALAEEVSRITSQWHETQARMEAAQHAQQHLKATVTGAEADLANARANAERDQVAEGAERGSLDSLKLDRAQLLGGRPTAAVRTDLNAARRARREEFQQAQDRWATAAQAHSAAESRVAMLAEACSTTSRHAAQAAATRDRRLTEEHLELPEVRNAMGLGSGWLAEAEAAQAVLREAETVARTVVKERRQTLAEHMASGQPERSPEDLEHLLPARAAERDAAREALAQIRQRLAEDDRNRGAAEETRRRIAEQRKRTDLWKGLAELIGSADGKKFRLFAQGLTLDRLIGLANRHLADLTPRYVLQRAPGADLDLQVMDRDMADEVRAVANLSGGERFLVSLSLALGLANMTGSRTLAESLFIDEGFGALDAESLDVAIGALETLHASGRKVGVISHVQAMIDRIGVQVRISKQGGGRSAVETRAA